MTCFVFDPAIFDPAVFDTQDRCIRASNEFKSGNMKNSRLVPKLDKQDTIVKSGHYF